MTVKKLPRNISLIALLFLVLSCTACGYDPLTITGTVVDEEGNALSGVSVWACYSGWGWSKEAGYLVWDKETCSETVQTNAEGLYSISFEGPDSSRLRVRKEGWIQSSDYNPGDSRIIMTRSEDYSARLRDSAKRRDEQRSRRKDAESDTNYYCRVVQSKASPVRLHYMDEILVISPRVLENENKTMAMFSVEGSSRAVSAFAGELKFLVNGKSQDLSFSTYAGGPDCAENLSFVEFKSQGTGARCDASVELLVPSVKAMFDANLHACPEG